MTPSSPHSQSSLNTAFLQIFSPTEVSVWRGNPPPQHQLIRVDLTAHYALRTLYTLYRGFNYYQGGNVKMTGFIYCKHCIDKRDDLEMTFQFIQYLQLIRCRRPKLDISNFCHLRLVLFIFRVDIADPPLRGHPHHPVGQTVVVSAPGLELLPVEREDEEGSEDHRAQAEGRHHGYRGGARVRPHLVLLLGPEMFEPRVEVAGVAGEISQGELADNKQRLSHNLTASRAPTVQI